MNSAADELTFGRARRIIARSTIAILVDGVWQRCRASVRTSGATEAVRRGIVRFHAMPAGDVDTYLALAIVTAVAGHLVMASLLPGMARPTVVLTALLLAIVLAAAANAVRRR